MKNNGTIKVTDVRKIRSKIPPSEAETFNKAVSISRKHIEQEIREHGVDPLSALAKMAAKVGSDYSLKKIDANMYQTALVCSILATYDILEEEK